MRVATALEPMACERARGKPLSAALHEPRLLSSRQLADRAVAALVAEAVLTPKPGLVDRRGSGAHRDLDLSRLLCSAAALHEGFEQMAECARGAELPSLSLREELGAIGRRAEEAMMEATGGSNAHRGAIWAMGLLVATRAIAGEGVEPAAVARLAADVARLPDRFSPVVASHGARVCQRYGVPGARGEACEGFPHVVDVGLPALLSARKRGVDETYARLDALMAIMSRLQDTCLLHRGGWTALRAAQAGARTVIDLGGTSTEAGWNALNALDRDLLTRWVSPGGSADLLAVCLFLDDQPLRVQTRVRWSN